MARLASRKSGGNSLLMNGRHARGPPHWALLPYVAGVLIGLSLSTVILLRPYTESITNIYISLSEEEEQARLLQSYKEDFRKLLNEFEPNRLMRGAAPSVRKLSEELITKAPIYYAIVMTDRHLSGHIEVLRNTWARDVPAKEIGFFIPPEDEEEVEEGDVHYGEIDSELGLVELPTSHLSEFHALQYICEHKINDTKWFFIANQDVYVKTRSLASYLQRFEGVPHMGYLGKPIKRDPVGRLCMPGPGTVLSYSTLVALCPKLEECRTMDGKFETECTIGECVKKHLDIQCNREGTPPPQDLFLKFDGSKLGMITEPANHKILETALTVYPVSDPKLMYLIHQFAVSRVLNESQHEIHKLKIAVDRTSELLPQSDLHFPKDVKVQEMPETKDDVSAWKLMNHNLLMSDDENNPAPKVYALWKEEIDSLVKKAMEYLNSWAAEEQYTFKKVVNAYWNVNPFTGIEYIVDFEATRPSDDPFLPSKRFRVAMNRPLNPPDISPVQPYPSDKYVNIAVFFTSEHIEQFQGFMKMLEGVLQHDQRINLFAVQMKTASERQKPKKSSNVLDPKSVLSLYKPRYPKADFRVIDTSHLLSRAHGISLIIHDCRPSETVFVADLDLEFDGNFIERCRNYPLQGQQVYFPIVYAKSDPALLSDTDHTILENVISSPSGYWLVHSYSTACLHAADLIVAVSNTGFKGIPVEIDMTQVFDGLVAKGYEVIRPTDKGLKRAFSPNRACDLDLYGDVHDPCDIPGEAYTSLYVRTQLSVLLFDHEGEYSETKF